MSNIFFIAGILCNKTAKKELKLQFTGISFTLNCFRMSPADSSDVANYQCRHLSSAFRLTILSFLFFLLIRRAERYGGTEAVAKGS
jgi:hypothetical protein